MVKKLRVSLALQPVATALFANSPFTDGKPNGFLSFRSQIWRDTDPDRSGMLPWAFEDGMGFEAYVDYALDVPMYFIKRGDNYIDVSGKSFRDFFAGKLDELPGERPTISDWANHSTIFPRCGSSVISKCAAPTAGRGDGCRRSPPTGSGSCMTTIARRLLGHGQGLERRTAPEMRDDVPKLGFQAEIGNRNVLTLAQETLRIATRGLPAASGSTATAATRRAICVRWKNWSRAASLRPRNCWRNTTASGAARSIRSMTNMRIDFAVRPGRAKARGRDPYSRS